MSKRDYYDVLGVPKGSEQEALKKAYRSKAKELHPDRNSDNPNAEAQFKEVNEAYEVLKDADKKAAYDRYGHAAFEGGGGGQGFGGGGDFSSAFSDVFDDLFGDFMGGGRGGRQQQSRGSDLRYNLSISLAEAFAGLQKTINVPSAVSCGSCNGLGVSYEIDEALLIKNFDLSINENVFLICQLGNISELRFMVSVSILTFLLMSHTKI